MIAIANTLLLVATFLPGTLLTAQAPSPRTATDPIKAAAVPIHSANADSSDAILASWLHSACTNHAALAGIALKQSKNAEVRTFAQKLVDDHLAFAAKLQPFTSASAMTPAKAGAAPTTKPLPIVADAKATLQPAGGFDHAALIRDLGAKCLQSETKVLTAKSGAEFDRCFLQLQVAAHRQGTDMVEVFKAYASPRLLPTLDEALKLLASHHERALALHQQFAVVVDGGGGSR